MIDYKTNQEIENMKEGGKLLRDVVEELIPLIKAGVTTEEIDKYAEKRIVELGGEPSFKRVPGYHWSTCLPVNEQVVHTPPSKKKLKNGDIFTLDIGVFLHGLHTDYATTVIVGGKGPSEHITFLEKGKQALDESIQVAKVGGYLGEISKTIEEIIYGSGYFILHELTGHGVGKELHEPPFVPGYLEVPVEETIKIEPGLVIAVEVIYSMGSEDIAHEPGNDWSIVSSDRSLTACFERTIAFDEKNRFILT